MNILIIKPEGRGRTAFVHTQHGDVVETNVTDLAEVFIRSQLVGRSFQVVLLEDMAFADLDDVIRAFLSDLLHGHVQVIRSVWSRLADDDAR